MGTLTPSETEALPWASILCLLPLEPRGRGGGKQEWGGERGQLFRARPGGLTGLDGEPSGGSQGAAPAGPGPACRRLTCWQQGPWAMGRDKE